MAHDKNIGTKAFVAFETNTRAELIKACHILAKGMNLSLSPIIIGVTGEFDIGKSLIADALLNTLDDDAKKYDVPKQNKMSLEKVPGEALQSAMKTEIISQGLRTEFNFTRSRYSTPCAKTLPQIIVLSHNDYTVLKESSLLISLTKPINLSEIGRSFRRKWQVTLLKPDKHAPNMLEQMDHLRQFHARRLYKQSLDIC